MKNIKDTAVYWDTFQGEQYFTNLLKSGAIVLGPSDTVLGLYGMPTPQAVVSLNELKNRCNKPYILLVKDFDTACMYGDHDQLQLIKKAIDACWPGPLTVVVKLAEGAPTWMRQLTGTIALRVPKHTILQNVLTELEAVFSTSANLAGQPVPIQIDQVNSYIIERVDGIVADSVVEQHTTVPSTIIDVSSGVVQVLRVGAYSKEYIENLLAQ